MDNPGQGGEVGSENLHFQQTSFVNDPYCNRYQICSKIIKSKFFVKKHTLVSQGKLSLANHTKVIIVILAVKQITCNAKVVGITISIFLKNYADSSNWQKNTN